MRGIILGTVVGLALGSLTTFALMHSSGGDANSVASDGSDTRAKLAQALKDRELYKSEVDAISTQNKQLASDNDELKKQTADTPKAPAAAPMPTINPMMIMGMMRGGFRSQQQLLLLKARLHLSPEQEAAVKAAIDADSKQKQDLMRQMFRGGKADPASVANANSLDHTLAGILNPGQMVTYKQVQADERASQADTSASLQVNQVAPLLQLSDTQKDQVFNALYQVQMAAPDPATLLGNPNAMSLVAAQTKAQDDAVSKILTPDQMVLYQQAEQMSPQFGNRGRRGPPGMGGQ